MEADHSSDASEASHSTHYCSVAEAMKLITQPFDGNKKKLREFIENVDVAFELVHPSKHEILLKFVKTKITGDARSKLIVRDLTHTWELVRGILEENYAIRRTLDYYACKMFSARQEKGESVASWGSRIDEMQTDLREAARRVCTAEEIKGAVGLINYLSKACFIQGLHNERIQTIVRSRGESILLSQAIEISLEEEGAILSVREKSGPAGPLLRCHKCGKLGHTANKCRSSEFFPQTRAREVNEFTEVDEFTEVTEVTQVMSCFRCGREGHIAKNCRQGSVCNNCRQGSVCRKCGMKGHTEINCRVQYKGWTKSGNEGREFVSNPRTAQTKKQ